MVAVLFVIYGCVFCIVCSCLFWFIRFGICCIDCCSGFTVCCLFVAVGVVCLLLVGVFGLCCCCVCFTIVFVVCFCLLCVIGLYLSVRLLRLCCLLCLFLCRMGFSVAIVFMRSVIVLLANVVCFGFNRF